MAFDMNVGFSLWWRGMLAFALFAPDCKARNPMPHLAVFPKGYFDDLVARRMSLFEWIDMAATLDVDSLELYPDFFESFEPDYLARVAEAIARCGLAMPMLCHSPDFTQPDPAPREAELERADWYHEQDAHKATDRLEELFKTLLRQNDLFVNIGKIQGALDRDKRNSCAEFSNRFKRPKSIRTTHKMLDQHTILGYKKIFLKRINRLIRLKLFATVIPLCGRGKDLNNQYRIRQRILESIFK